MPVFRLTEDLIFPPPELAEKNGLLAVGGDLSPKRLLLAYQMGIFPWFSPGEPILWWSPSPRLVLFPKEFRISRRLGRLIRQQRLQITMDTAFRSVIEACASMPRAGQEGTWITPEMIEGYVTLHELGYAHSVECWLGENLAGGLYGIALGKVFFGESMFSRESNASKVALATLVDILKQQDCRLIDCQLATRHLISLGAREIPGREFHTLLRRYVNHPFRKGKWPVNSSERG